MSPPPPRVRTALPALLCTTLALGACGGSGDDDGASAPPVDAEEEVPPGIGQLPEPEAPADASSLAPARDEAPAELVAGGSGLRLVVDGACGGAGDEIVARLFLSDDEDPDGEDGVGVGTNVTSSASFDQGLGSSIELVSLTDDAIRFRFLRPDIVSLTATLGESTLTRYFGAWPDDAPAASALRKEAPAGCLWALRLPPLDGSPSFCAGVYSRGAAGRLGLDDRRLDIAGCEATANGAGLPIVELEPVGSGS